jgi:hypothetical protein
LAGVTALASGFGQAYRILQRVGEVGATGKGESPMAEEKDLEASAEEAEQVSGGINPVIDPKVKLSEVAEASAEAAPKL